MKINTCASRIKQNDGTHTLRYLRKSTLIGNIMQQNDRTFLGTKNLLIYTFA